MTLSIIIPVLNEKGTIGEIIKQVSRANTLFYEKEIIVVDDGSSDGTEKTLEKLKKEFRFILIKHPKNLGKGVAIKTALKTVTGDLVLIQDADLEYEPKDYQKLLKAFSKSSPVIYGSRSIFPQKRSYWYYALGVNFLNFLLNLLFSSRLTDVYTCYKLFPASLIKNIPLESKGFEFEVEVTAKILKKGIPIKEVPIHYYPRTFEQGKKIRSLDGLTGLWTILKNRVR